ncbi:MAG: hypothetical protein QM676_02210 [Novosphingobium sp.]
MILDQHGADLEQPQDHDRGLTHDLQTLARRAMERRRALAFLVSSRTATRYIRGGDTTESYLRGVQVTDANGEVTFTTIYPVCYSGRRPHMHFEIFRGGLAAASTGSTATLIAQLAMPAATNTTNTAVFNSSGYSTSLSNYSQVSLSSDSVFGSNTSAQLAQMTPTVTGSVAAGYTATATIGIRIPARIPARCPLSAPQQ